MSGRGFGYDGPVTLWRSKAALVVCVSILGCRPQASVAPPAPAPPVPAPSPAPPPKTPEPPPSTVVARVGDTSITLGELTAAHRRQPPSVSKSQVLLQLVERELVRRAAREKQVVVIDDEIDRALALVAESNGITTQRLQSEVAAQAMTWAQYREEIAAQLLEAKLMRTLNPRVTDTAIARANAPDRLRRSMLACLRADTPVEIDDPELALPEEPLAARVTIEAFAVHGETGLPVEILTAAAQAAVPAEISLCRALTDAEDAVTAALGEAGFLAAKATARWPESTRPRMTIDVDVAAGSVHRFGTADFDQSELPRSERIDVAKLRRALGAHLRKGDIVSTSGLTAAAAAVNESFGGRPLGMTGIGTSPRVVGDEVFVDLTYHFFPR